MALTKSYKASLPEQQQFCGEDRKPVFLGFLSWKFGFWYERSRFFNTSSTFVHTISGHT